MPQLVSITSQGQMSIPAQMRRELGFDRHRKAVVKKHHDHIVVKPVKDLLEFAGAFKHKAIQDKDTREVIELEEQAAAEAAADKYRRENR